jgi:predicted phosphodiesterase
MFKFYVVGDTHGDLSFASKVCKAAERDGVTTIFQVGDFGIWSKKDEDNYFLDKLNENAGLRGVHWYVTLGNHENYDMVEEFQSVATGSFIPVRENITVLGNKTAVFELQGVKFGSVGGAVSIDREMRIEGKSWWPQENTKYADVQRFMDLIDIMGPVDVLLTHDAPSTIEFDGFYKNDVLSNANRAMMDVVGDIARAKYWFHGHYHRALAYRYKDTHVVGLGANPEAMPWHMDEFDHKSVAIVHVDDDGDVTYGYTHEWCYKS